MEMDGLMHFMGSLSMMKCCLLTNTFLSNIPFLYPLKTLENPWFSGGTEMVHWTLMGYFHFIHMVPGAYLGRTLSTLEIELSCENS